MTTRLGRLVRCAVAAAIVATGAGCSGGHGAAAPGCATGYGVRPPVVETGSKYATSSVVAVSARDFAFFPTCTLDVPRGSVTLVVHNAGGQVHNVSIGAQHLDRDVAVGATVRLPVTIGARPVVFVCRFHRGLGMVGVLVPTPTP